ncbi:DUF2807 domain-containing protein [Cryomorphaceae bacterium 1068]|nr:DUF2807 domain-containing protein [Cryomorphaceae bacterium 1068]
MKQSILIYLLVIPLVWACDKKEDAGPIISEIRTASQFSEVELDGSHEFRINPDFDFDIRVTAPDNLMRYIETYVTNGRLVINEKNNDIDHDRVLVEISENFLDRILLNGSGIIIAEDTIYSADLEVEIDGSGSADIIAKSDLLRLIIDGSGRIEALGESEEVRSAIYGSGLITSPNIESNIAEARIEGSGSIDIHAGYSLFARIDGSGVIRYWGDPETIDSSVDGSGAIIEIN